MRKWAWRKRAPLDPEIEYLYWKAMYQVALRKGATRHDADRIHDRVAKWRTLMEEVKPCSP